MLYVNAKTVLPNFILNYLADRMEMAHSIEGRVPFLDHHVAEVAARVPVNMKVKGIREKHVLREAAKDVLIPQVYDRQKHPFTTPPTRNTNDPMLTFYRDTFASQAAKDQPIYDMKKVAATLDQLLECPDDQRIAVEGGLQRVASVIVDARAVLHDVSRGELSLAHFAQHCQSMRSWVIVRSFMTPSIAAMRGRWFWWLVVHQPPAPQTFGEANTRQWRCSRRDRTAASRKWLKHAHGGGGDTDRNLVAGSGFDGQVQAQFGDPAVERMPGAVRIGAPEERVERVDRLLPEVQPIPAWANLEGELEPDGSGWQFCRVRNGGADLLLERDGRGRCGRPSDRDARRRRTSLAGRFNAHERLLAVLLCAPHRHQAGILQVIRERVRVVVEVRHI
jgi:Asparagine synthase